VIAFDNSYARELEGLFTPWPPSAVPDPHLILINTSLADELGLDQTWLATPEGVATLAGNNTPAGSAPLAQAYSGHQFGGFSPVLGDGRALLLGEVIDRGGHRRDLALKGSGRTPFSRGGDGKAGLGPVLREYVLGEAMHALGIPTTRALAVVTTGERIRRTTPEAGAVLTRVASSHLRVGTFQFAATQRGRDELTRLVDYSLRRHYPDRVAGPKPAHELLEAVVAAQAALVAAWMSVGFIHGVMNTDNMTISGETIDYGPCAFLEAFDPQTVYSSIDTGGRYRFANQPPVAVWNLARFAESLLPLLDEDQGRAVAEATEVLDTFGELYRGAWLARMRRKLGLADQDPDDEALVGELLALLAAERVDYTSWWRALAADLRGAEATADLVLDRPTLEQWQQRWHQRLPNEEASAIADQMDAVNPIYVPRNHLVEAALAAAIEGDLGPVKALLAAVTDPFVERADWSELADPATPEFNAAHVTYCGT
jgi:uncharacterized protein YdiU (UPF0061 family)